MDPLTALTLESILVPLCGYLQSVRGVAVTPGELLDYLGQSKKKKKEEVSLSLSGTEKCLYVFVAGVNKGKPCAKPVSSSGYCRDCLKKAKVKDLLAMPQIVEESHSPTSIGLQPLPDKPACYYVPSLHYIVRKEPNETYLILGCGEKRIERALRAEEKEKALALGFRVLEVPDN